MAGKNKRFYWLKLKEDFFSDKRILMLRSIAGGDTYTIIYLKLLLLSLQNEGMIFYEGVHTDFVKELALISNESEENISVTLTFLKKQGLLEEVEKDEFYLTQIPTMIGSETASTVRSRISREKNKDTKVLQCNTFETPMKQKCNTEKEIEQEKEKDIDLDIDLDIDSESDSDSDQESKSNGIDNEIDNELSTKQKNLSTNLKYKEIKEIIYKNIDYENIVKNLKGVSKQEADGLIELMIETIVNPVKDIKINGVLIPHEMLIDRFLKLKYEHIEYTIDCIRLKSEPIRKLKRYTISVLYNSYTAFNVDINNQVSVTNKEMEIERVNRRIGR